MAEELQTRIAQAIADETEQGSESWLKMRLGKFTASEIHRLMTIAKRPMNEAELAEAKKQGSKAKTIEDETILSDGAQTYIEEKVSETLTGLPAKSFTIEATEWGSDNEDLARKEFERIKGVTVKLNGHNIWKEQAEDAGGSSDGIVESLNAIIEIKCPFNSANHIRYCLMTSPIEIPEPYYWQMQANMLFSEIPLCYFISYDPRVRDEKYRLFVMEVQAEPRAQALIKTKLSLAIKEKKRILEALDFQK